MSHNCRRIALLTMLLCHALVLSAIAQRLSPVSQELSVVSAGLYHTTGRFDHFRVNPPFLRSIIVIPLLISRPNVDWSSVTDHLWTRNEIKVGQDYVRANPATWRKSFLHARFVCIGFSCFGAIAVYLLSRELFGPLAGLTSCGLWCFSPVILSYGALSTGDVQFTAINVFAMYLLCRWLKLQSWSNALGLGLGLGLAISSKHTGLLVVGAAAIAVSAITWNRFTQDSRQQPSRWRWIATPSAQYVVATVLSVWFLACTYHFNSIGNRLDSFQFVSRSLAGPMPTGAMSSNRFKGSIVGRLPMPFPADYILGLDIQKRDLELRRRCYLLGKWHDQAPWWFYFVGLACKESLGSLLLLLMTVPILFVNRASLHWTQYFYCVVVPGLLLAGVLARETQLWEHLRYAIPLLPCCYITISAGVSLATVPMKRLMCVLLLASCSSSVYAIANPIAFENSFGRFLAGDRPALIGSCLDWGQDLDAVVAASQGLPTGTFKYLNDAGIDPSVVGIAVGERPHGKSLTVALLFSCNPDVRYLFVSKNVIYGMDSSEDLALTRWTDIGGATVLISADGFR